jgi:CPA2 family monovalent cation:H+ antiporter-2
MSFSIDAMSTLELTLLYLLAAVLGVVACRSLKLPPMLGYLAVGVVIGPHALGLSQDAEAVRHLGEFGVVFLMFVIGLEFNLPRLRAMRRHVFGLGLSQVTLTILFGALGILLLTVIAPRTWGMSWQTALALAGALSMSSTAVVVKLMADRGELESEHGQRVVGVLLFQDLAVVPLLVLIPALGASPDKLLMAIGIATLKAVVLITVLLTGGHWVMRWWLTLVARRKSEELFVLNLLLITLGLAWLTELAGLSLALGAFIAGMLISETEFKHQVETDIRPFHDVLLGLFFITIGMMLNWRLVADRWPLVLLLVTVPVLFKLVLVTALARLFGATTAVSLRTGLYLAQAGEFGFVLLTLAQQSALVPPALLNPILAGMVLSMLATPFIVMYSNRLVMKLDPSEWLQQSLQMTTIARKAINANQHVIICGYGRCGQNLARMLDREHIPYMALDLDPDRVRQAAAAGDSVVFGDATRLQALMATGLSRASAVVVTYLDVAAAMKVLGHTRSHAPQVPVIVRTQDDRDLERLRAAGATEVVPEAIEGSLMLASHALALLGVPMRRVLRSVQEQRDARYDLLRGYFHGADDDTTDELEQERLSTLALPEGRLQRPAAGPVRAARARRSRGQPPARQRRLGRPRRRRVAARGRHPGAVRPRRGTGPGRAAPARRLLTGCLRRVGPGRKHLDSVYRVQYAVQSDHPTPHVSPHPSWSPAMTIAQDKFENASGTGTATVKKLTPFGGYFTNREPGHDRELTEVGPGTPMGEYMRRSGTRVHDAGADRHPAFPQDPRRGAGVLPRRQRPHRPAARPLRAPGRFAGVRQDPAARHLLLLPRHGLRRRRHLPAGSLPGRGGRGRRALSLLDPPGRVQDHRTPWSRLRLHGSTGAGAALSEWEGNFTVAEGDELVPYSNFQHCNWLQVQDNSADNYHTMALHAKVQVTGEHYQGTTFDEVGAASMEVPPRTCSSCPIHGGRGLACAGARRPMTATCTSGCNTRYSPISACTRTPLKTATRRSSSAGST